MYKNKYKGKKEKKQVRDTKIWKDRKLINIWSLNNLVYMRKLPKPEARDKLIPKEPRQTEELKAVKYLWEWGWGTGLTRRLVEISEDIIIRPPALLLIIKSGISSLLSQQKTRDLLCGDRSENVLDLDVSGSEVECNVALKTKGKGKLTHGAHIPIFSGRRFENSLHRMDSDVVQLGSSNKNTWFYLMKAPIMHKNLQISLEHFILF